MLMRTTLLKDAVQWGNNKDVSWKNEPTLRNWLENTYAARLSEDTLKTIVPVTIRYDYGSESERYAGRTAVLCAEGSRLQRRYGAVYWNPEDFLRIV